jgi:hypothetical protein
MLGRMRASPAVLALGILVAGCGSAPPRIDPTGVDELTIPTPTPDPDDFVARVDNEYLPLAPGSTWTYRARGGVGERTVTVTVAEETVEIQGVAATVVHDVARTADGALVEDGRDWFAQDTAGNVWWFGEHTTSYDRGAVSAERSWQAGEDGAEAGLAMPAEPRVGDGYRQAYQEGVVEDRAAVLDVSASLTIPYGDFDDLLRTEHTTPLAPELVEHRYHAPGVGLVYALAAEGGDEVVELVSFTAGR